MNEYLIDKPLAIKIGGIKNYKEQKELDHYQALGKLKSECNVDCRGCKNAKFESFKSPIEDSVHYHLGCTAAHCRLSIEAKEKFNNLSAFNGVPGSFASVFTSKIDDGSVSSVKTFTANNYENFQKELQEDSLKKLEELVANKDKKTFPVSRDSGKSDAGLELRHYLDKINQMEKKINKTV